MYLKANKPPKIFRYIHLFFPKYPVDNLQNSKKKPNLVFLKTKMDSQNGCLNLHFFLRN